MPPLFEGSMVYMPTALPGFPLTSGVHLMQKQDRILRAFPEVESVFGTVGRADSATDNAPMDMFDTTIMLKPRNQWPPGMTYDATDAGDGRQAQLSRTFQHLGRCRSRTGSTWN